MRECRQKHQTGQRADDRAERPDIPVIEVVTRKDSSSGRVICQETFLFYKSEES